MAPAPYEPTTELVLEVFRLNGEVIAMGDALVGDLGLSSARWQVMGAIVLSAKPLPIAQIARNMGLTRQAVQRIANELEAEGFVRFAPNPSHKRAQLVLLTRKGESTYAAVMARWQPAASAISKGIDMKSLTAALLVLRRLRQGISSRRNKE